MSSLVKKKHSERGVKVTTPLMDKRANMFLRSKLLSRDDPNSYSKDASDWNLKAVSDSPGSFRVPGSGAFNPFNDIFHSLIELHTSTILIGGSILYIIPIFLFAFAYKIISAYSSCIQPPSESYLVRRAAFSSPRS